MKKDWTYKKLGEVCMSDLGKTLNHSTDTGTLYPYLCAINVLWDKIDLSTFEGMATFKHWVEHEFLEYLKANYADNPLIAHLQKVPENQRDILATDIDLLNPNTTSITRLGYDEILRGMAEFETVPYKDSKYNIADLFQLYNILVNSN